MSADNRYREILRSSSIIGGASVLNILIGLLKTKAAALLLGPSGVGLIGLFQNLVLTAAAVASLGFGAIGTRQIAEAAGGEDPHRLHAARRALFLGTAVLAAVGAFAFWLLRAVLADRIVDDAGRAAQVGWLALGVALTVAAGAQTALLNGLRRIGDIARVNVWSALLSTLVGVAAVWRFGSRGLIPFVLALPVMTFLVGQRYVARVPRVRGAVAPLPSLLREWRALVRLGSAFMVAGVGMMAGQLALRTLVQHKLGGVAQGQLQAAWAISMTYIGFVLSAMGTDYYPRLTAVIGDHKAANRMVNEQSEVALLLAAPVLLGMLALAPWVIRLLYSAEFSGAATILQWQVLGDVLKVATWPLGFVILAAGDGRTYLFSELLGISVCVALAVLGIPLIGLEATGVAFAGMYAVYLPTIHVLARRRTGFAWAPQVKWHLTALMTTAGGVFLLARWSPWLGVAAGAPAALGFALYGFNRLGQLIALSGPLGRVARITQRGLTRIRGWYA